MRAKIARIKSSSVLASVAASALSICLAGAAVSVLDTSNVSDVLHCVIAVVCCLLALWAWPATTWQWRPICWAGFGASLSVLAILALEQAPAGETWGQVVILGGAYLGFVAVLAPLILTVDRHARVWPGARLGRVSAWFAVQCGIAVAAGAVGLATVYVTALLSRERQMGDLLASFWLALLLGVFAALAGVVRADRVTSTPP